MSVLICTKGCGHRVSYAFGDGWPRHCGEPMAFEPNPDDVRYECPVCHWGITLTKAGEAKWTQNGTIEPRCRKDHVLLTKTYPNR
jgi:hypothetical protein